MAASEWLFRFRKVCSLYNNTPIKDELAPTRNFTPHTPRTHTPHSFASHTERSYAYGRDAALPGYVGMGRGGAPPPYTPPYTPGCCCCCCGGPACCGYRCCGGGAAAATNAPGAPAPYPTPGAGTPAGMGCTTARGGAFTPPAYGGYAGANAGRSPADAAGGAMLYVGCCGPRDPCAPYTAA